MNALNNECVSHFVAKLLISILMRFCLSKIWVFCTFAVNVSAQTMDIPTQPSAQGDSLTEEDLTENLLDLSLEELMSIEVSTSSKRLEGIYDAPGVMSVVTAREIELFGANDLTEVLSRVTSVQPLYSVFVANNVVPIRGDKPDANETHVLVLLNGNPFNRDSYANYYNQAIYSSFPVSAIEKIEIIRGPGSVLYGTNAFSGIINIITKKEGSSAVVRPAYGGFNTKSVEVFSHFGSKDSDFSLNTSLRYFDSDGWMFSANGMPALGPVGAPGVGSTRFSVPLSQNDNLGLLSEFSYKSFSLSAFYGHSNQATIRTPVVGQDNYLENDKYFLDLGYKFDLGKEWNLITHLSHVAGLTNNLLRLEITDPYGPPTRVSRVRTNDTRFEATVQGKLGEDFNFLGGAVVNWLNGRFFSVPDLAAEYSWNRSWYGAYMQLDYRFNPYLKVIAGAQVNQAGDLPLNFVPRVGSILNFTSDFGLKALYGEAFRAPLPGETLVTTTGISANPNLIPEEVTTIDLELFYHRPEYQLSLTYYHSNQFNLIARTNLGDDRLVYQNRDQIQLQGLEFESKISPNDECFVLGSFSIQASVDNKNNYGVALAPNFIAKTGVGYTIHPLSFGVYNSLISPYKDNEILNPLRSAINPPSGWYSLLSANMTLNLNSFPFLSDRFPQANLSIYGTNLFDVNYFVPEISRVRINTIPGGPGRSLYVTLELAF